MAKLIPADGGSNTYDLGAALKSALTGSRLTGFAGEVSQHLANKHGDQGLRIPLQAIMTKATGSSALITGAVPLNNFDMDSQIAEIDGAVKKELLATKFGVSSRSTSQSEFRIPRVDTRPNATIVDVDEAIPDQGGSTFDYVSIKPVIAGSLISIANSLDFSNPDAVAVVTRQISDVVREAIDNATISGYGPTGTGLSFAGLAGIATATGLTLNSASTIAGWAKVKEFYSAYVKSTDVSAAKWLMHPRVADEVLSISPMFAGSMTSIAMGGGINTLLSGSIVTGRLPVNTAPNPDTTTIYYGEPSEVFLVLFDSASISLVANPYEATAFSKGSTLLRVMVSFGMGVRDGRRLYKATVELP